MVNWIRAEDAPDHIKPGRQVLMQSIDGLPQVTRFDPNYDRRTWACGGVFFAEFDWPPGPEMDHSLPDRVEAS